MVPSNRTVVVLLHKHFLFTPTPFFNSPSIITNCKYAAINNPNITIYEVYPENKFRLRRLLILWQGKDAICRHSNSVYASCCLFIMFKKIENPTACEMRSVIHSLNVKNMKPGEIHRQLCDVYGEHAMSSSMVRRWVRLFNEDAKMCTMICVADDCLL